MSAGSQCTELILIIAKKAAFANIILTASENSAKNSKVVSDGGCS